MQLSGQDPSQELTTEQARKSYVNMGPTWTAGDKRKQNNGMQSFSAATAKRKIPTLRETDLIPTSPRRTSFDSPSNIKPRTEFITAGSPLGVRKLTQQTNAFEENKEMKTKAMPRLGRIRDRFRLSPAAHVNLSKTAETKHHPNQAKFRGQMTFEQWIFFLLTLFPQKKTTTGFFLATYLCLNHFK